MERLENFKKGVIFCANVQEDNNRMRNPEQFDEVVRRAEKLEDLVIDLKRETMKWKKGTRQMIPVVDKTFEFLVKYNPKEDSFEVVKNLGDSPVPKFPMGADLLIEELINPATSYSVIGVWDSSTDFSQSYPW